MIHLRPFTAVLAALSGLAAAAYQSFSFTIDGSEIYPGTSHEVTVTLSDGYRADSSAILYLGLDGILCHAPQVFDSLVSAGVMKPVVGVFLQPGVIRDNSSDRVLRYNRSNEFDAITPSFATFLESEVLPAVAAHNDTVCWSAHPADHVIFGLSSGGIAAFNAAWHRPQMWGNVFSGCGTFVPMRGGEQLQVWVRKAEPRPIRVFLQDGFSDTWNPLFGSWYEANRMLASALEFAGYDCAFDWAEGGHSVRRATEIFPDVISRFFTTNANPQPTGNDLLAPLLIPGESWVEIPYQPSDNPLQRTIDYPGGGLRVRQSDTSNVLLQSILTADGTELHTQPFYWLHSLDGGTLIMGGMAYDDLGNLWVITSAGLQILDQNGRVRGILMLPDDLDIAATTISLQPGCATLTCPGRSYTRRLNTSPASTLPPSQGQG